MEDLQLEGTTDARHPFLRVPPGAAPRQNHKRRCGAAEGSPGFIVESSPLHRTTQYPRASALAAPRRGAAHFGMSKGPAPGLKTSRKSPRAPTSTRWGASPNLDTVVRRLLALEAASAALVLEVMLAPIPTRPLTTMAAGAVILDCGARNVRNVEPPFGRWTPT